MEDIQKIYIYSDIDFLQDKKNDVIENIQNQNWVQYKNTIPIIGESDLKDK